MTAPLTDLHTHILPGMDDGAPDLETARKLLCRQRAVGVTRVMLTPHFYPSQENAGAFLSRRQQAFDTLLSIWNPETMPEIRLGAEVRYSAALAGMDILPLTLGGSSYLLLELSDTRYPAHIQAIVSRMLTQGVTPILAHIERCAYFRQEPNRLTALIQMGVLAQVSAGTLYDRRDRHFSLACLENGLAHVVASDTHGLRTRPPCLPDAMAQLRTRRTQEAVALSIWENRKLPPFPLSTIRKGLFRYR